MSIVLNDLYDYEGMKIYQNEDNFKFSLDSILLAEFVDIKKDTNLIIDFCSGNAPVLLILSTKCNAYFKEKYGKEFSCRKTGLWFWRYVVVDVLEDFRLLSSVLL